MSLTPQASTTVELKVVSGLNENPAAGTVVSFDISTSSDTSALRGQVGYTTQSMVRDLSVEVVKTDGLPALEHAMTPYKMEVHLVPETGMARGVVGMALVWFLWFLCTAGNRLFLWGSAV